MAGKNAGRQGSVWRKLRADLKAQTKEFDLPCGLCGQAIDTTLHYLDEYAFEPDHKKSKVTHPELAEDPSNLQPSHRLCNQNKGHGAQRPGLGDPSEVW